MVRPSDVTVIIPAYNEEASVGAVGKRVLEASPGVRVLVVDDCSTDGTSEAARRAGLDVIRHDDNLGNGAAVKTGIRASTTPYVLLLDADGQHPPEAIPQMLDALDHADLVAGCRPASAQAPLRRIGNWVFNHVAELLSGRRIPDLTTGFRAMRRDAIMDFIHLLPDRFSYPTTSTLCFMKAGYRVRFLAVERGMQRRQTGTSSIKPVRDGIRFLLIMARISILFNPVRVFSSTGLVLMLGGAAMILTKFYLQMRAGANLSIEQAPMLLILSGLILLFMGFLADLVSTLSIRRR